MRRVLIAVALFFLASVGAFGQQTVRLIHADSLVGYSMGGDSYRELMGHVRLEQDTTMLQCDRAVQNLTSDVVELFGDVRVRQDTLSLFTDHAVYSGRTRIVTSNSPVRLNDTKRTLTAGAGIYDSERKVAQFFRNVAVRDSASSLRCDTLFYYRDSDSTIANGEVEIVSRANNVTIYGRHFEDHGKRKYSLISGKPLLVQKDTASDGRIDTLMITGKTLKALRDSVNERFIAEDSVRIIRGLLSATCGLGTYYSADSLVVLQKNPVVWYEDNQLTGDSVSVFIRDKNISRVDVNGAAFAASQSDSLTPDRFNQLKGRKLTMYLRGRKVSRIIVESNATSLYYLYDKEKPNGANKVSGDKVVMYFTDGKIDRISVISGVEGDYYPENMVRLDVSGYSLPGFVYHKDRPQKNGLPSSWK